MSKSSSTHRSITMGKDSFGNSFDEAPLCCKGPNAQRVSKSGSSVLWPQNTQDSRTVEKKGEDNEMILIMVQKWYWERGESMKFKVWIPRFKSKRNHLLAWWCNYLTTWHLSLQISKVGIIRNIGCSSAISTWNVTYQLPPNVRGCVTTNDQSKMDRVPLPKASLSPGLFRWGLVESLGTWIEVASL